MRIVQRTGRHSWRVLRDDERDALRDRALAAEARLAEMREAAWWVVMHWDTQQSQHGTMGRLREMVGLGSDRPTREEALARLDQYLRDPTLWGRSEAS